MTLRESNRPRFWNVRPMPSRAICQGLHPTSSFPLSLMDPDDRNSPVMQLNSVDLPAPFGPMIAKNSPGATVNDTSESAATPPKLIETPSTSSSGPVLVTRGPPSRWTPAVRGGSSAARSCSALGRGL